MSKPKQNRKSEFDRPEIAGVKARLKTTAASRQGLNTLEKLLLFLSLNSRLAFTHAYKIGSFWQETTHNLLLSIQELPDDKCNAVFSVGAAAIVTILATTVLV